MHRVVLPFVFSMLSAANAWAGCEQPVSTSDLQTTLDAAEAAYGRADVEGFEASMAKVREQLPCVAEALAPSLAAQLHRLEGMHAFATSAMDKAVTAFAAARALDPDYRFPTNIVPPGNPLLAQYEAREPVCEEERIPPPKEGGKVRVDGQGQRRLPTEFPAIVQVLDPKRGEGVTQYHWPGDPLPYDPGRLRTPAQTGLLVGGTAVAVAGVATMLFGQASTSTTTTDFPGDILAKSRQRSTFTGVGAGMAAAGLTTIGVSFVLPTKGAAP